MALLAEGVFTTMKVRHTWDHRRALPATMGNAMVPSTGTGSLENLVIGASSLFSHLGEISIFKRASKIIYPPSFHYQQVCDVHYSHQC